MVRLECPQCSSRFDAQPGVHVVCQNCGYAGGPAPADPRGWNAAPTHPAQRTNPLAIASLVVGAGGLFFMGFFGLSGIISIVLGIMALQQIRETKEEGRGMAVAGIVIGACTLVLFLIFFIIQMMWMSWFGRHHYWYWS